MANDFSGIQKKPKQKSGGCLPGCLIVFVIIVALGVGTSMCSSSPGAKEDRDRRNASIYAEIACKDAVKQRLKSPSSAKFHDVSAFRSAGHYKVTGSVDADNSFGASMRNSFSCDVKVVGDHTTASNVNIY